VLFERFCRRNGIVQRLTKPYSPTTTGKVERCHQTLQLELLNVAGPFAGWPMEKIEPILPRWLSEWLFLAGRVCHCSNGCGVRAVPALKAGRSRDGGRRQRQWPGGHRGPS